MSMGLFWKRTKSRVLTDRQELLAGRVAAAIVRRQTRVANYLNRKTQYWNRTSKLVALALFCLVFGGISLYLLLKAI
ncbi:hypothetical protein [Mucilaginibacter phenanthrenivorans]|uniref:hypothetical protein n=1 Tax=Mucilaginibacter phenanthrenivorans TaxID=1234842 RepID=UPI002157178D|nr:hypothetical protein [Mucilaginibacter phenanthrenivorans]